MDTMGRLEWYSLHPHLMTTPNSITITEDKEKIVLDLCGGTGSWSEPYKNAGYDVRLITLPMYDVTTYVPPDGVYGILAAPPCTHFSLARTTAKIPRNFKEGLVLVDACLHIIRQCRLGESLKFWALENPVGYLRQFLGKPPLTWQPCDYGDPYTKKTDLWGYYKEPRKTPVTMTQEQIAACSINNRELPKLPEWYKEICPEKLQAARRAMTPQGFAKAFFKANP